MTKDKGALRGLFGIPDNRAYAVEPKNAIFPRYKAPVVRLAGDGERELVEMTWGFVRLEPGKAPRPVTNTRDDKVLTSSFWKSSFQERRCLVPATAFCEPRDGVKPATWHWFALRSNDPRPLFAFAGIWRTWNGPVKKDGPNVAIDTYSFMTTVPNELTRSINHERMPMLLTAADQFETWLRGSPAEAFALIKPYPAEQMRIVQEGFDKEDRLAA